MVYFITISCIITTKAFARTVLLRILTAHFVCMAYLQHIFHYALILLKENFISVTFWKYIAGLLLQISSILITLGRFIKNELAFRWIYMQFVQVQVMFVQYQAQGHTHWVPKAHLDAHRATRASPSCQSSTTQPELPGCMCCSIVPSDMLQPTWSFRKLLSLGLSHPYNLLKEEEWIIYIRR